MIIRAFQSGDEANQAEIYNSAAASLPFFKPVTTQEIQRRTRSREFDPQARLFAEVDGKPVGYASFQPNGRVSFPWCLPGHEQLGPELFNRILDTMRSRNVPLASAAYRTDWTGIHQFFLGQGFKHARDMMNYVIDLLDLPTASARMGNLVTPVTREDIPTILQLCPQAIRVSTEEQLEKHLLKNPYFGSESIFALRSRNDGTPVGVAVLISEPTFAHPRAVDAHMPCYRLGAFGSEGMQVKRINGMFSFIARPDSNVLSIAMELLGQAVYRLRDNDDLDCLAAQIGSDVPALMAFYQRNFRLQGKFPVFEMPLR